MSDQEHLRETLLNLERARQREHQLRVETEAILKGLHAISNAKNTTHLFEGLVEALKTVLQLNGAFILQSDRKGCFLPIAATMKEVMDTVWSPQSLFKRVLNGHSIAVFDVNQIPEWSRADPERKLPFRSAMHIRLLSGESPAILVITHAELRHFGASDVKLVEKFVPLVSQAMQTLKLQKSILERDRFFDMSLGLMGITGIDGEFKQVNSAWTSVLGYSEEELKARSVVDIVHDADKEEFLHDLAQAELDGGQSFLKYRFICKNGSIRWLACSFAVYPEERLNYIAAHNVTEQVEAQNQLAHDAEHDALTGLTNRVALLERLNQAIALTKRNKSYKFALLFFDLDQFKIVNDSLGHIAGDEMLLEISKRLKAVMREEDIVARLGGDEFIILLSNTDSATDAIRVANRLQTLLKSPIQIAGREVFTSASIGVTHSDIGYKTAEEMLRDADTAMYTAKSQGRSCYVIFDKSMHEKAVSQLQLENDLRRALENEEFELYYQPIIDLSKNVICGFESLLRWRHPERGMVSPIEFIPIAEDTGLIVPLGKWVYEQACQQLKVWQMRGGISANLTMNINISTKQFWQQGFVDYIRQGIERHQLDPATVSLEITESVILYNAEKAVELFHELKMLGINIHVDDFGTGYSSLSYIHKLPFNGLKIDRSFIKDMETNKTSKELVNTIVMLANNLNLKIVAEGVETQGQLALVRNIRCGWAQGYLFSPPLSQDKASNLALESVFPAPVNSI